MEDQTLPGNRVLVGLPERLNAAKVALKDHEKLIERMRQVVSQKGLVDDKVIVDQIMELLQ